MNWFEMLSSKWIGVMYRAVIVIGPMFVLFWVLKPGWLMRLRVAQPKAVEPRITQDLLLTVMGLSVYLIPGLILMYAKKAWSYSPMYLDINERGWGYFIFTLVVFAVVIDTWFYWAHRLMHCHEFFKKAHAVHHKSYNVTPLTSYSFHLVEALINMFPYAVLVVFMPWHPLALSIFGMFGIFYVSYIHLGYDVPASWRSGYSPLKIFYSSTQHSIHHQKYDGNFAVYFTFWDKIMKTELK